MGFYLRVGVRYVVMFVMGLVAKIIFKCKSKEKQEQILEQQRKAQEESRKAFLGLLHDELNSGNYKPVDVGLNLEPIVPSEKA